MARELIDLETARQAILDRVEVLPAEEVRLEEALGRVLWSGVSSRDPVPPFDNSAMDGYAVRASDTEPATPDDPVSLRVVDESRAGSPAGASVAPGEAIAISTGAMMPGGADAVVRLEEAALRDGRVEVAEPLGRGRDVRRAGDDIGAGETVLAQGAIMGPAELGVAAAAGHSSIHCASRPRLSVLTTGDELAAPGDRPLPGQIRDSNSYSVPALGRTAGALVTRTARVEDDPGPVQEGIEASLDADVTVICGGVSVGAHDHVRPALAELGASQLFWGVALRPGRPTWFGLAPGGGLVFGLPGNPVSAVVTFLLFVRPAVWAMMGAPADLAAGTAILDTPYEKRPGRAHAVRVRLEARDEGWHARPTKEQGSHVLTSMLGADALAMIPAEAGTVSAGTRVKLELLPGTGAPIAGAGAGV
jgi:molybdopterin molybdotransferase